MAMGLNYLNLDQETRKYMAIELNSDIEHEKVYLSPRLNKYGKSNYINALKDSFSAGDDTSLSRELRNGYLAETEQRKTKNGYTTAKVPVTAPDTLAEGEFNRYYIRALCRRALENTNYKIVAYRAKEVSDPRPASEAKIGESYDPQQLLNDLRDTIGVDTGFGLPPGPNSGLTVQLRDRSQEVTA
jgi:hypothetical protein